MVLSYGIFFFYIIIFIDSWVIFSKISGITLTWQKLLFLGLVFTLANLVFDQFVLIDQLFFIVISFIFAPQKKISEHIFNGLFAIIVVELLIRIIGSLFLSAVLGFSVDQINQNLLLLELCHLLVLPAFYLFNYIFAIDLSLIRFISEDKLKKWVFGMNLAMSFYYIFVHFLVNRQSDVLGMYVRYRSILIFIYLTILIGVIVKLDRFAKDQLSQKLALAQDERIGYLETYNQQIEHLYRDIRTVKHDSENILISLKDSIDRGDLTEITKVYQTVVQESASSMKQVGFDVSLLENIQDLVVRSLINSKLLEAQHEGIDLYVEIPDVMDHIPIKLLDLVVLFTVLIDQAISSAKGSRRAFLSVTYFKQDGKQLFIIENSTRQKRIDIAKHFSYHQVAQETPEQKSLTRFLAILDSYPKVTFSTKSDHYRLRQMLEMR